MAEVRMANYLQQIGFRILLQALGHTNQQWGGKHNQWYMHWFAPEQPDFNWDNPEIEKDFLKTLKFWADRGVDGFRIDVAHALKKDLSEPLRNLAVFEGL